MKEKEDTLTVVVRIRPISVNEVDNGYSEIITAVEDNMVCLLDPTENDDMNVLRVNRSREKMYVFDNAFGPFSTQTEVYNQTTRTLVESVLEGYNATIFAYGPTGAGKTFTMLGTDSEPGIMALTLNDLYRQMENSKGNELYTVSMSYLEIYNEMIRDLLNPSSDFLDLREDYRGVQVAGLTSYEARDTSHVMEMLSRGNKERMCEPTAVNKTSSRSHAVLQVTVEQKSSIRDVSEEIKTAKLFMIDLAGSERAAQTQNTGKRFIEGAHINRSLLALGNCINALAEKGSKYINYRDSKLTRLLKDSLGGNCKTVMIAHVSPASGSFEESRNTLMYADRAKNIKLKAKRNQHSVNYHVSQYQGIISELREEVIKLKAQLVEAETIETRPTAMSADRQTIEKLKDNLKKKFQEQLELRKELIDLEDSSLQFAVEYQRYLLIIDEWEQEELKHRTREPERVSKANVRQIFSKKPRKSMKSRFAYDPFDIERKDDDDEKSSIISRSSLRPLHHQREPADVIAARDELDNILQQQDEIECRKKEINDRLTRQTHENQGLEETMLRRASNENHREVIKSLCFLHEYQIRNMELESMALMKEFLLQQKDLETQRSDMRRRLVDEVVDLQKNVITENELEYPSDISSIHQLYKEQVLKDTAMLSSLHIESKRYGGSKIPSLPSIRDTTMSRDQSPTASVIRTRASIPRVEQLKDRPRDHNKHGGIAVGGNSFRRTDFFNDTESISSRYTATRDPISFPSTDNDQMSETSSVVNLRMRKAKKNNIINHYSNSNNNRPALRKKETFTFPKTEQPILNEETLVRTRGKTFRVSGKPESDEERSLVVAKINHKHLKKRSFEIDTASLKDSELASTREEVEGRKRSASAGMIREKVKKHQTRNEKLLPKRNNMVMTSEKESKPTWNNNFSSKKAKEANATTTNKTGTRFRRTVDNLPTLKKAKFSQHGNMLIVGASDSLAVSGTSFIPKQTQPGFGRI
ncbi:kinesin-like protein KIF19 isoform X3 [Clytia hemisphaerica]